MDELASDEVETSPRSRRRRGRAVNEIDWENYLDNYSAGAADAVVQVDNEELPSLESTLTQGTVAATTTWRGSSSCRTSRRSNTRSAMPIIGNLDADGYLKEPPLARDRRGGRGVASSWPSRSWSKIQTFDPVGVGARSLPSAC